uniref:ATP-dependent RNA helicase Ski2/MTR4 C-terminal domain-containing protein n=1 Tax=Nelumbo nucifera TaxID=4432 RepID=A0A822XFN5_NELNU|nr:TPA_asm: hypothetical protein HUJ06_020175 [Nelumbo nucifera]
MKFYFVGRLCRGSNATDKICSPLFEAIDRCIPGPHIDKDGALQMLEIGCIDADLVVQIKGLVACEMNSREELICTECLFENQLDDLEPEEVVALMSVFVFQQKNQKKLSLLLLSKMHSARDLLDSVISKTSLLTKGFLLFLYLFNGLLFFIFV